MLWVDGGSYDLGDRHHKAAPSPFKFSWKPFHQRMVTNLMSCTLVWTAMRLALTLHFNPSMSPASGKQEWDIVETKSKGLMERMVQWRWRM
jgi:hypothetical protein